MKRFLAIVLTLCMLISMSAMFVSADAIHEDDEATLVVASGEDDYGLPPENIFPFIYSLAPDWKFFREYVGVCNCKEGYLYAKNTDTNVITQLYADPVVAFAEANTNLYFITLDNKILRADYEGKNLTTIYSGGTNDITHVDYHNNKLFFAEGAAIRELNLSTMVVTDLTVVDNVTSLIAMDSNTLVIRGWQAEQYIYEKQNDKKTRVYGEYAVADYIDAHNLGFAVDTQNVNQTADSRAVSPILQNDVTYPLPAYPNGSYFSTRSGGCNHDTYGSTHCKAYGGAYQCMGFARYASDQFAHIPARSNFINDPGDHEPCYYAQFLSDSEVRVFFSALTKGAYVRLSAHSSTEDTNDPGTHSIVYVNLTSTGVQTYDANRDSKCGVKYEPRTFLEIRCAYPYRYEYVSHHYSTTATHRNATTHKYNCANCVAYVTAPHVFEKNSIGQNVCVDCGYMQPGSAG